MWAAESDLDPGEVVPGTFTMEWPRGSGRFQDFPEVDRVEWWGLEQAREKIEVRGGTVHVEGGRLSQ